MTKSIELKRSVVVNGREWRLYSVDFTSKDGAFSTYIYATSLEHAASLVEESARNTASIV